MNKCSTSSLKTGQEPAATYYNRKVKSYVWHYFDRIGDKAKCRVCRYEIGLKKDRLSTTGLIRHLEHTHALEERGVFIKDISSIPTLSRWPRNMGSCMRDKVLSSFEVTKNGIWNCKRCSFAVGMRRMQAMFHHLRKVHWKANGPAFDDFLHEESIAEGQNVDERKIGDYVLDGITGHFVETTLENRTIKLEETEELDFSDVDDESGIERPSDSSSRSSYEFVGGTMIGTENTDNSYEMKINLPNGEEVMGFVVGAENNKVVEIINDNFQPDVHDKNGSDSSSITSSEKSIAIDSNTANNEKEFIRTMANLYDSENESRFRCVSEEPEITELDIQDPLRKDSRLSPIVGHFIADETSVGYEFIKTEKAGRHRDVAVITLNRPAALNALSKNFVEELNNAVTKYDKDDTIGAIIITGNEQAFAAGFDIKETKNYTYARAMREDLPINWHGVTKARKPVIAAVNGYALGSGFELALACDMVYAGKEAHFGLPEIAIGSIPGSGGTQRLARVVGKTKAMEMILTGNQMSAVEAERSGLVSKIFPSDQLLSEAVKIGERISAHSQLIVSIAKKAVNTAYETTLTAGLEVEGNLFAGTLATADRNEGIAAFVEKRAPNFRNA